MDPIDDFVPEDKARVAELLKFIEDEKRKPNPDKKRMRKWFWEIVGIKQDFRTVYTGQNDRFMVHTSERTWRDDC